MASDVVKPNGLILFLIPMWSTDDMWHYYLPLWTVSSFPKCLINAGVSHSPLPSTDGLIFLSKVPLGELNPSHTCDSSHTCNFLSAYLQLAAPFFNVQNQNRCFFSILEASFIAASPPNSRPQTHTLNTVFCSCPALPMLSSGLRHSPPKWSGFYVFLLQAIFHIADSVFLKCKSMPFLDLKTFWQLPKANRVVTWHYTHDPFQFYSLPLPLPQES